MSSKYDLVKVKILLNEHYYVFSRFLLSKMLTFCNVPTAKSVTLALDLKKQLVDSNQLEVSQVDLQRALFELMTQYGYGGDHILLFGIMTDFYSQRVPLVVLIAGSGCTGKSSVAHLLGSKLSNHNVISTDVVSDLLEVVRGLKGKKTPMETAFGENFQDKEENLGDPIWVLPLDEGQLLKVWSKRCEEVAAAVDSDIKKALLEGKVIVIEGSLLNLALFQKYILRRVYANDGVEAIVVPFLLTVPLREKVLAVETWLSSRSHFLSHLSSAQQVEVVLERFNAVEKEHGRRMEGVPNLMDRVLCFEYNNVHPAGTVTAMHQVILDRIIGTLAASRKNPNCQ